MSKDTVQGIPTIKQTLIAGHKATDWKLELNGSKALCVAWLTENTELFCSEYTMVFKDDCVELRHVSGGLLGGILPEDDRTPASHYYAYMYLHP